MACFLTWVGAGLLGAGLLALPVAALLWPESADPASPLPLRTLFWLVVGFCGFLVALFWLPAERHTPAVRRGEPLAALGIGVAAAILAYLEFPAALRPVLDGGTGQPEAVLRWFGLVSVALGAASVAVLRTRGTSRPTNHPLLGLVSGIVVVLVVAVAAWAWTGSVRHTTAEAPTPGPVPSTVREVAWTWAAPRGTRVHNVRATAAGAVVETGDGVVALDTATGEEWWH